MKNSIPLNPQVLQWARSTLGLSRQDVALRLKKSEDEIRAWEEGSDSPTYSQLENLA